MVNLLLDIEKPEKNDLIETQTPRSFRMILFQISNPSEQSSSSATNVGSTQWLACQAGVRKVRGSSPGGVAFFSGFNNLVFML